MPQAYEGTDPPKKSSSPGSPGFLGAVKDAINAIGSYVSSSYKTKSDAENDESIRSGIERTAEEGVDRLHDHSVDPETGD